MEPPPRRVFLEWQWAALGLAATFLLALTVVAGFAIYTWGWRDRADQRGLAEAYANTSLASLCRGQACVVQDLKEISPGLWEVHLGGSITTCGLIDVNNFKLSAKGGSQGLSTIPCTPVPLKHANLLSVAAPIGLYHLLGAPQPPSSEPSGFEADLVDQIAQRLGIGGVSWIDSNLNTPATVATTDFLIGQQVVSPLRASAVDFSVPYFTDRLGLLARTGTRASRIRTYKQAATLRLGAADKATRLFVKKAIKPRIAPRLFKSSDRAFGALKNGALDAVVIDLVGGYQYVVAKRFRFAAQFGPAKPFAIVFAKNDPLLPDVNRVLKQMRSQKAIRALVNKWFIGFTNLPLLSKT